MADYLVLKGISQATGVSMSEVLHRLIEHQAQLPLMSRIARPALAMVTEPGLVTMVSPSSSIATNGSKVAAFRITPKGVRYA